VLHLVHRSAALALIVGLFAVPGCADERALANPPKSEPKPAAPGQTKARSIHALTVKRLDGTDVPLASFAGKVLLIVNTASECGFTPQYAGLEALYEKYQARGFAVLGFPANDFGGQEPGSATEIASFCKRTFGVTFPMFEKVKTIGAGQAPLYGLLAASKGEPKWNFHKYLIDKHGLPVEDWPSMVTPDAPDIASAIERELRLP
jgi:glutathione peroxidase